MSAAGRRATVAGATLTEVTVAVARAARWRHSVAWDAPSMGGRLRIAVTVPETADGDCRAADERTARRLGESVARRVAAWADRLTRFDAASDLSTLNASPATSARIRPTLVAVLAWAEDADARSGGIVDVTMLRERLAAEAGGLPDHESRGMNAGGKAGTDADTGTDADAGTCPTGAAGTWRLARDARGGTVTRTPGLAIDLDGVAKGWIADRALGLLATAHGAAVDADGDVAVRLAPGDTMDVAVADPRDPSAPLGFLALRATVPWDATYGIATSGTSVHRWQSGTHHLIDPRTRRPAITDVVQATVLARSARDAEVLAKTAVILGRDEGLTFLDAAGALAAVVLTERGECLAPPRSLDWLAAA